MLKTKPGALVPCRFAIIPPHADHAIEAPVPMVTMLYIDPDSDEGVSLGRLSLPTSDPKQWRAAAQPLQRWTSEFISPTTIEEADTVSTNILTSLIDEVGRRYSKHRAIRRIQKHITENLLGDLRLQELAMISGLSSSYISHLFPNEVGVPIRPYILWQRIKVVGRQLQRGESLTVAAHAAGFTDSSHMNRVFKRMFGLAPSEVSGFVDWVVEAN